MSRRMIFAIVTSIFLVLYTFPLIRGYLIITDWIYLLGHSVICIILFPKAFYSKSMLYLFIYYFFLLVFVFAGHEKYLLIFSTAEILTFFSASAIINICLFNKDYKLMFFFTSEALLIALISFIITVQIVTINPEAIRDQVMFILKGNQGMTQLVRYPGMVSYAMLHAVPFIIPVLIYHFKHAIAIKVKIALFLILALFLYVILNSGTATPIIFAVLTVFFSLLIQENVGRTVFMFGVFAVFYLLFAQGSILLYITNLIYPYFSTRGIGSKILDFQNIITYGQISGHFEVREELYNISWKTFLNNPILGSLRYKDAGGHAYFADKLAYLGLIGSLPLFLFFYFQFRGPFKLLNVKVRFYYLLGILTFITLGFLKNIDGYEYWLYLFLILPSISLYTFKIKNNRTKSFANVPHKSSYYKI